MLLLSVVIAVVIGTFGLFGFSSADASSGRVVEATVVTGQPCDRPGAMETVRYTIDGRDEQARLDACGHRSDEPVEVRVTSGGADLVVHAAQAATGDSGNARRLGLLLLAVSGIAGAAYYLLVRRGPRGRPVPVLGRFVPPDLTRFTRRP
ncbi:MAG TPA: hypothetical protein VGX25_17950 [Actinophytocola sp.]|uniref:hypothetical protein n=1 Tax=Actinophytocola sp. TaxID=1872138 RepID=UPI002DDD0671|nr:hypothetical protein [Actinophytocola sp.]HEV2781269.1 hypothetical protein [Actinophytocola sp.]